MFVQIVMNKSLTYYGALSPYGADIPLACTGIVMKVNQVYFSICIGVAQGIQPIASFNRGAGKNDRVKKTYKLAVSCNTIISTIAFIIFQLFPRQIISLFGNGSELYFTFAERYFHIYLFFTFINNIQPMSSTFFSSIGKPKKGTFLAMTRQILFLLPLILIFPLYMGIDGIMYAGPVADLLAAIISVVFLINEIKKMGRGCDEC